MHENAARALQYYEDLPRRSGRPELRLVDSEPRTRRHSDAEPAPRRGDRHEGSDTPQVERAEARTVRVETRGTAPRRRHEAPPRSRPSITARRRQAVAPRIAGRPDRVAMWAVLLGFFLTGVAAATGHG
jgi:hypothetical protein